MLVNDPASLVKYKRLRPTWQGVARTMSSFLRVSTANGNGAATFVSDGFWLLVDATLPDEIRPIIAKRREESFGYGTGIEESSIPLPIPEHARLLPAKLVSVLTEGERVSASGKCDALILRTSECDIAVNPRFARWVEKWGDDKGQWYVDPDMLGSPLRYICDGELVGLLMPFREQGYWLRELGLGFDRDRRRYYAIAH
jgi:hypothetical protein